MGKMKTLQQYINEDFRISHKTKINECFVYKLNEHSISKQISIFGSNWEQFDDYKDKVYDDKNRNIKLTDEGLTKNEYSKGVEYKFYIKDIDDVTNCNGMFFNCDLISVPLFNTSHVTDMNAMFDSCTQLKHVPMFNISDKTNISWLFSDCDELDEETKQVWSKIYDFNTQNRYK